MYLAVESLGRARSVKIDYTRTPRILTYLSDVLISEYLAWLMTVKYIKTSYLAEG